MIHCRLGWLLLFCCGALLLAASARATTATEENRLWQQIEAAPAAPGAWLDLAVFYCEHNQGHAADRIFHLIEQRYAPPPGIRELIALLRQGGCQPARALPVRENAVQLRLFAGTDSNPNQGVAVSRVTLDLDGLPVQLLLDPGSRPQPDRWQALELAWLGTGEGWQPFVLGALRRYRQQNAFDTDYLVAGLQRIDASGGERRLSAGVLLLAGQRYETVLQGYWQSRLPYLDGLFWGGGVTSQQFARRPEQDSVQFEPRLILPLHPARNVHARLAVGGLLDHPWHDRPGGMRYGFDVQFDARAVLRDHWLLDTQLRTQWQRDSEPYSPLFGRQRRAGVTTFASLALSRRIATDTLLSLNFTIQRARDDLPLFSFDRRQVFLGLEHLFQ